MLEILFLAIAGGLGTVSRYGLSGLAQSVTGTAFPFGTLLVNFLGSLVVGFLMQVGLNTDIMSRSLRVVSTIGFLGAFTTFSTFSYETVKYLEHGAWLPGIINMAANVGLCIIATLSGMFLARTIYGGA